MKADDEIMILPKHDIEMPLDGERGRIVEVHAGYVLATVGDDPRTQRRDYGTFLVVDKASGHLGGAE